MEKGDSLDSTLDDYVLAEKPVECSTGFNLVAKREGKSFHSP